MRNGNHQGHPAPLTSQEITQDILHVTTTVSPWFKRVVLVLGFLFILGIVGFVLRASDGFDDHTAWGYYAALFGFLLTTTQTAVLVSIALRFAKGHWRRPLSRASELFAVVGLFNLLVYIPLAIGLPSAEGRSSLLFQGAYREGWPPGGPQVWDTVAMVVLVLLGLAVLYLSALPDLAVMRDHGSGRRQRFAARLTPFWRGTEKQWLMVNIGLSVLGAFYFLSIIFMHTIISTDFAMSLVPGWKDALFPTFHALSSLQTGVATVVVTLFLMKKVGGFDKYVHMEPFWAISKLMLALTILWFYFWASGFLIMWYGRLPIESRVLDLFMTGPYEKLFFGAFFLSFLVPFLFLIWNPVRKSIIGPTVAASIILVGSFIDRLRIYVASYSVEDVYAHTLEKTPAAHAPDVADILILIGGVAGAILVYLLASKVIPIMSIWETKEGSMYTVVRPFLRRAVTVLGKPQ